MGMQRISRIASCWVVLALIGGIGVGCAQHQPPTTQEARLQEQKRQQAEEQKLAKARAQEEHQMLVQREAQEKTEAEMLKREQARGCRSPQARTGARAELHA